MKIVKNSHAFVVTSISSSAEREAVRAHCLPLLQRESFKKPNGDIVYGETKKYYSFNKDKTECRFHINDYQNFIEDLRIRGVRLEDVEIVETPLYTPTPAYFKINDYYKPRDNQPVIIQYFLDPFPVIKMCELETGGGKTFTSLFSLSVRESRGMLSIRPQYFDNWYKAIFGDEEAGKPPITDLTPDRMLTIQGSIQLKDAIRRATEGDFDYDFIMISNVTLYKMFKVYEEMGSTVDVYGCEPWELCQVFGVGTFMKDEGHLDFHANYRLDLYLHVPISITLSGTFSSENVFIKRMQLLQHPQNSRAPTIAPTKFRAVKAVRYSIDPRRELRYKLRGRSEYNHNQLEESILKDKRARHAYLELIRRVFENEYLKVRTAKDQKALILCGRVEMAEVIIQHLVEHYPELTIGRYVSGDSFMEAITNEVLVTTIISGKAAIDVPNLILAFNTVNVGSKETNLQALGRIRELKHIPEIRPQFVYLYTDDISSASYYHQHKIQLFASRVFSHHTVDSGVTL